tara:strand:- start:2211 stop:2507 length:297 start_codon:yes stop_codon:yes gene_type:complete
MVTFEQTAIGPLYTTQRDASIELNGQNLTDEEIEAILRPQLAESEFTVERDMALRHWRVSVFQLAVQDGQVIEGGYHAYIPNKVLKDPRFKEWVNGHS